MASTGFDTSICDGYDPVNGTTVGGIPGRRGNNPWSYPEFWVPKLTDLGVGLVRDECIPYTSGGHWNSPHYWTLDGLGQGTGSMGDATSFWEYCVTTILQAGLKLSLSHSDWRAEKYMDTACAPGGLFHNLGLYPTYFESINENGYFLPYQYGTTPNGNNQNGKFATGNIGSGNGPAFSNTTNYYPGDRVYYATNTTCTAWKCISPALGSGQAPPASGYLPNGWWVPDWAYDQVVINYLNRQRINTKGLTKSYVADGGNLSTTGSQLWPVPIIQATALAMRVAGIFPDTTGPISYADYQNIHDYKVPWDSSFGIGVALTQMQYLAAYTDTSTGLAICTEFGATTDRDQSDTPVIMLRSWFDAFYQGGISAMCYYILLDQHQPWSYGVNDRTVWPGNTTIAAASNGLALPQASITIVDASTAVNPHGDNAVARVTTSAGNQYVNYTGISGNQLTGCTGGTGTMSTGGAVAFQPPQNFGPLTWDTPGGSLVGRNTDPFVYKIGSDGQPSFLKSFMQALADIGPGKAANKVVGFHWTGVSAAALHSRLQPLIRKNGQIDIPIWLESGYGQTGAPYTDNGTATIVLDSFTAQQFQWFDYYKETTGSSSVSPGQTNFALNGIIQRYPILLRITPG